MKSQVSPAVMAIVIVLAVVALSFVGWKYMGSSSSAPSEDLKPTKLNLDGIKPSDFDQIKKDLQAAGANRSGTAGGGPNKDANKQIAPN